MPDKRPNDAQLRFNARASNSKRRRNSDAKAHRPKNRRLPDSPEIFFQSAHPFHDRTWTIFPGTFVLIRALPIALLQGSRTKDKFYSPPIVVPSTSPPFRSSTLGTAMYREQWKWLSATLNPGKASLIRHQRQNQRHRWRCNSRVNSPPCAWNTEAAETCPLITGVS